MKRGETPNQIAEAFDRQYKIPPILTIGYIAQERLRLIGRVRDTPEAQAVLAWLASDRQEALPSARELIGSLDERRNVFGGVGDVHSLMGASDHPGALLATRAHLYFFAESHHESFVQETFKETWLQAFPQLHLLHMGTGLAQGVRAELTTVSSPALRKELEERFDLPDSFAIPWRDVTSLGKQPVGSHPPAIEMVIRHGEGSDEKERRFSFGTGFNEEAVDNMIDVARAACALEGRLLMF
jgi:hypothetical protein